MPSTTLSIPPERAASSSASSSPSVLLIDQSSENREVLRFALERRGIEILEADELGAGLELARRVQPQVVVLDLEMADDVATAYDEFDHAAEPHAGRLVVLGSLRVLDRVSDDGRVFAKPYHFAPLIHKIEELLAGS